MHETAPNARIRRGIILDIASDAMEPEEITLPGGQKPSKPEDDLVAYIRQLELPIGDVVAVLEASAKPLNTKILAEEHQILIQNVYKEMAKREAALATHKLCSQIVDSVLQVSSASQILRFLKATVPYTLFLATNRYASHVFEGLLSIVYEYLCGQRVVEPSAEADDEDAEEVGPKTPDAIRQQLIETLQQLSTCVELSLGDLMFDVCGTHVVRALVELLAGRQPQPHKRGAHSGEMYVEGSQAAAARKINKNKDLAHSAAAVSAVSAGFTAAACKAFFEALPAGGAQTLRRALVNMAHRLGECERPPTTEEVVEIASGAPHVAAAESNLLGVACDVNASPTTQLMLDACLASAPATAKYLCRRFVGLSCDDLTKDEIDGTADIEGVHLDGAAGKKRKRTKDSTKAPDDDAGIAGTMVEEYLNALCFHSIGSHLVESILLHADAKLFNLMYVHFFQHRVKDLTSHTAANFVLQRLLVSCRSIEQTEELVQSMLTMVPSLASQRKDGVIWHMAAACVGGAAISKVGHRAPPPSGGKPGAPAAKLPVVPVFAGASESVSVDLQKAFLNALALTAFKGLEAAEKYIKRDAAAEWRPNDPHFIRFWLDIHGYRAAHPTLEASPDPGSLTATKSAKASFIESGIEPALVSSAGERIIATLMYFNPSLIRQVLDSLVSLPASELGSVASAPYTSRHVFEAILDAGGEMGWAKQKIHSALRGLYAPLACTRFGCWVVTKAFNTGDLKRKVHIAEELGDKERAVVGNASGRQVAKAIRLEHFNRNRESWEASWSRVAAKTDFLSDILGAAPAAEKSAAAEGTSAHKGDEEAPKSKRARIESESEAGVKASAPSKAKDEKRKAKKEREEKEEEEVKGKEVKGKKRLGGAKVDAVLASMGFK